MNQTKRHTPVLRSRVWACGWRPHTGKIYTAEKAQEKIVEWNRKAGQNPPRVVAPIEEGEDAPITSFEAWRGAFESSAHPTRNSGKIVDLAAKSPHFSYQTSAGIMCLNVIRHFGHESTLARKSNSPFRICKPKQIAWKRQTPGGSQTVLSRRWDHYLKSVVYVLTPVIIPYAS
jgi:hypothetical protein